MYITGLLWRRWRDIDYPFLLHAGGSLYFNDITNGSPADLSQVRSGDVVALIGDFDGDTILNLMHLIDRKTIIVPLTADTREQHDCFFQAALVDVVIENGQVRRIRHSARHRLVDVLRRLNHAGLVLFSTGRGGQPKAILHDLTRFTQRFRTPQPVPRTLSSLHFDQIGGWNTLFHTLYNKGTVVAPGSRNPADILETCCRHNIEVLPTSAAFLQMILRSGRTPDSLPPSLRVITYGSEQMDQATLDALCSLMPTVDFRQVYDVPELGIVSVRNKSRDSLFMQMDGDGTEIRVVDGVLEIRSSSRMLGYLNADDPFDDAGWFNTEDVVEIRDGYCRIVGRTAEVAKSAA